MSGETLILGSQEFGAKIKRIAFEILENAPAGKELALVGIHSRGVPLASRVAAILASEGCQVETGSLDIAFYRDDIHQRPTVLDVRSTSLDFSIDERHVILFDDVIHTGRTIRAALNALLDYGRPSRVELAVVVDRGGRELPVQPDYLAMDVRLRPGQRVRVALQPLDEEDAIYLTEGTTP